MKRRHHNMEYNITLLERSILFSKNTYKWDHKKYGSVCWKSEPLKGESGEQTKPHFQGASVHGRATEMLVQPSKTDWWTIIETAREWGVLSTKRCQHSVMQQMSGELQLIPRIHFKITEKAVILQVYSRMGIAGSSELFWSFCTWEQSIEAFEN